MRFQMTGMFARSNPSRKTGFGRLARRRSAGLRLEGLETRELLAISPGQLYQSATYFDGTGNKVEITVSGPVTNTATQGFTVELAGLATDNADATTVSLQGLGASNGVQILVTPVEQPNAGPNFNKIYSSGYTSIGWVKSADSTMTRLGGIQMSAAVVNSIQLPDVTIDNISLDPGQAPYVDRINTTNNAQSLDSTKYQSVTGLIDMGGINAANIGTLVINGAISNVTGNPYDLSTTNDFRSVINVSGRIDSIVGLRSNMAAAVYAKSIGSVRVAAINGILKTTDSSEPFYINMPGTFKGFIDVAGHLDIGFPMSSAALITGTIISHGGISGTDKSSTTDPIYLPGDFVGSLTNDSSTTGIADINVDGIAGFQLSSTGTIGNIYAGSFGGAFIADAGTSIGNVTANSGAIGGHFKAGTDIGNFSAVAALNMNVVAGGNVGDISSLTGLMESPSIQAGGNIGAINTYLGINQTSFVAGGDFGPVKINFGDFANAFVRARKINDINVIDGSITATSLIASNDIGNITTFGSIQEFGMGDVSVVAGRDIGQITASSHQGDGMEEVKIDAGRNIAGVTGNSYGQFGTLFGSGIFESNIVAGGNIGPVVGYSSGGSGIQTSTVVTRPRMSPAGQVDTSAGSIASITGNGWLDGLLDVIVVAHTSIGDITGKAINNGADAVGQGNGISGGSYDANYGPIGQIIGEGAATAGWGILNTRFQSTDKDRGNIQGVTVSGNAVGQGGMSQAKIYGAKIGPIVAVVHGGVNGVGIDNSEIVSFWGAIGTILVNDRAINGVGIQNSTITSATSIGNINVSAFMPASSPAAFSNYQGYAIKNTTFRATASVGTVTVRGRTVEAYISVNGQNQPITPAALRSGQISAAAAVPAGTIGDITIDSVGGVDLTIQTYGSVGNVLVNNGAATSPINLKVLAASQGDVIVTADPGVQPATVLTTSAVNAGNVITPGDLTLNASAIQTAGSIKAGGNVVLVAAGLISAGDLIVTGNLNMNSGLQSLAQLGTFDVGSLSAISKKTWIGSKLLKGSSIGPIRIGSIAKGKGEYDFAFSQYTGMPNAIVAGKSANAKAGAGQVLGGIREILTPGLNIAKVKTPMVKLAARKK